MWPHLTNFSTSIQGVSESVHGSQYVGQLTYLLCILWRNSGPTFFFPLLRLFAWCVVSESTLIPGCQSIKKKREPFLGLPPTSHLLTYFAYFYIWHLLKWCRYRCGHINVGSRQDLSRNIWTPYNGPPYNALYNVVQTFQNIWTLAKIKGWAMAIYSDWLFQSKINCSHACKLRITS